MTIRSYGRSELAQLYFPLLQPVNAWRCLQRWITLNHELSKQLTELGYSPRQRIFTSAQVGLLFIIWGSRREGMKNKDLHHVSISC